MKKIDILTIDQAIDNAKDLKSCIKFKYAIIKNKELISKTVSEFKEIYSELKKLINDFEQERVGLIKKYGESIEDGFRVKEENMIFFEEDFKVLSEKWKPQLLEYEAGLQDIDKLLLEEVDYKLRKVTVEELPEDLTAADLKILLPMIEDF